jgi:shikimate kinase
MGEKENREVLLHVTGDLVHLKVKDIKTIEELPKLTKKPLAKERNEMVKKKECGTRNQFYGS